MKAPIQIFAVLAFLAITTKSTAQDVIDLWEGQEVPYFKDNELKEYEKESWGVMCTFDVTHPTLTVYRAEGENSGKAVIVLPGGGYSLVAVNHEGHEVAKALARQGITAGVLKYRLPDPRSSDQPHLVPLTDTRRALRLLRSRAEDYEFDKSSLGVVGFSAGSHLATVAGLWKSEDHDENPDFSALIYGVTNLSKANLSWLEKDLYHRKLTQEEIANNKLLNLVREETPPSFLVHACDDKICNVEESTLYAQKLLEHNIPVAMHLFTRGGHGFGLGRKKDGTDQWLGLFVTWLKALGD